MAYCAPHCVRRKGEKRKLKVINQLFQAILLLNSEAEKWGEVEERVQYSTRNKSSYEENITSIMARALTALTWPWYASDGSPISTLTIRTSIIITHKDSGNTHCIRANQRFNHGYLLRELSPWNIWKFSIEPKTESSFPKKNCLPNHHHRQDKMTRTMEFL